MKLTFCFLIAGLFFSCNTRIQDPLYDYLRSPSDFRIHPLAEDTTPPKKFILSWQNPSDTAGFRKNWIFLDTTNWKSIEGDKEKAKIKLGLEVRHDTVTKDKQGKASTLAIIPNRDSILISLADLGVEEGVEARGKYMGIPYFVFDSARVDLVNREFKFALISDFSGRIPGQPRFTSLPLFDNMKPWPIQINVRKTDKILSLSWRRPKDPVSFFEPENDSGLIRGYWLTLLDVKSRDDSNFIPLVIDSIRFTHQEHSALYGGKGDNDPPLRDLIKSESDSTDKSKSYDIFFPDHKRFHYESDSNKLSAVIHGFHPLQKYQFQLYPIDSSGNEGKLEAEWNTIIMTDTTKPLAIAGNTVTGTARNAFSFVWAPTRDSRETDSAANQNIAAYHVMTIPKSEENTVFSPDTALFKLDIGNTRDSVFIFSHVKFNYHTGGDNDPKYEGIFNFLSPGKTYNILIWAVDSTGFHSDTLAFSAQTDRVDSTLKCHEGYVPIPADTPFCIEVFEHHNDGAFTSDITRKQAEDICRRIGEQRQINIHLCTRKEWERACRGDIAQFKHKYGIQSVTDAEALKDIKSSPDILQRSCNQGTDDREMAFNLELRNRECSTNEGVFDLAGNLSEWVEDEELLFKGGNFLKPEMDVVQIRKAAECNSISGRPYQYRPKYYPGCISEMPNLSLVYKKLDGQDSLFCPKFEHKVNAYRFPEKDGVKDSSRILVTFLDSPQEESIEVSFNRKDTIIKPVRIVVNDSIQFLVVNIIPDSAQNPEDWANGITIPDTLFYRPFYFSDEKLKMDALSTHPLLERETNSAWRVIPKKKLYGFLKPSKEGETPGKPAKDYFSHEAVGFRCCYTDSVKK